MQEERTKLAEIILFIIVNPSSSSLLYYPESDSRAKTRFYPSSNPSTSQEAWHIGHHNTSVN